MSDRGQGAARGRGGAPRAKGQTQSLILALGLLAQCAPPKVESPPPQVAEVAPPVVAPVNPAAPVVASAPASWPEILNKEPAPEIAAVRTADRWVTLHEYENAKTALEDVESPAAQLVTARAWRGLNKLEEAERALRGMRPEAAGELLGPLVILEQSLIASERGDRVSAAQGLLGLIGERRAVAERAVMPLIAALVETDAKKLVEQAGVYEKVLPKDDLDARSRYLEFLAQAYDKLGRAKEALAVRVRRYLEEPVSTATPDLPPAGATLSLEQNLKRGELLLDTNRNERAIQAFKALGDAGLDATQVCRRDFGIGLAARKLRHYEEAETYLGKVTSTCKDTELVRRAMYLNVKVISIRDGLRAIPVMEEFAKKFPGHSMVDDVLFWAGDLYERRKKWKEAEAYYRRIEALPQPGDQCAEARWRRAWMAYRKGELAGARTQLQRMSKADACVSDRFDRARAVYWLGRVTEERAVPGATTPPDATVAIPNYRAVIDLDPMGYYGQLAMQRIAKLSEQVARELQPKLAPPPPVLPADLCAGFLEGEPALARGVALLRLGLDSDAAAELRSIPVPEQQVLADTHAAAMGVAPRRAKVMKDDAHDGGACGHKSALLLLALLLDRAGAYREAHWRLRTDFGDRIEGTPGPEDGALLRAAYPLAYRDLIEPSEHEAGLPNLLLQALSREESALDAQAVSWAGAYGLTQLLLESGQAAGKLVSPPVTVAKAEDLLDPRLNARLGGALLGSQVRKFAGNVALALAAYNAGDDAAAGWWTRHAGAPFDIFAEEITIKETRGYVKRVLKTFGIYRWLYAGESRALPIAEALPPRS